MDTLELARTVFQTEIDALIRIQNQLNGEFTQAMELIRNRTGRVVVVGMGKSGLIGRKIAATMASTGTSSFYVHPGEAFHGDLGMIHPSDIALLISNSGETEEIIRLLSFLEHQSNPVIALTGRRDSTLGRHADVILDVAVEREACEHNLAPTASTTATLVMGDALAVALSSARHFQPEDFARFHPGGSLGRQLLTRVADVMHTQLPVCHCESGFREVINTISAGRLGLALVMDGPQLRGIITDGDVRRTFDHYENPLQLHASEFMTADPATIAEHERLSDAEAQMQDSKITALVVMNSESMVSGVLQIHDL